MIKAIETKYDGRFFRSRTEARWAVFFNYLDLKYDYEKEGFKLDHGYYLPDFWLSELDCWIEIKGENPTENEKSLCEDLANETDKKVVLFVGTPQWDYHICEEPQSGYAFYKKNISKTPNDTYRFCKCSVCRKIGIEWAGCNHRICNHEPYEVYFNKQVWTNNLPEFKKACSVALSKRFECKNS